MDFFLPSDIARLVLGYLKENKFHKTHSCFLKECPHLTEYCSLLLEGRELQTTILGFSLLMILDEWGKLKQGNSAPQNQPSKRTVSPSSAARKVVASPLKQALATSPHRAQHVAFSENSKENSNNKYLEEPLSEKEKGYPLLKCLLDTMGKKTSSTGPILPLTPEKDPPTHSANSSPLKDKTERNVNTSVPENTNSADKSVTVHGASSSENEFPATLGLVATSEISDSTTVKGPVVHLLKTPCKPGEHPAQMLTAHLVTPVKLFQAENTTSTNRSPRRKKPKTPRKRTSDIGSLSGSEDVPEPVFKKILEDNRLHEKLAETCNSVLESMNHSGNKEKRLSGHGPEKHLSGHGPEKRLSGQGTEKRLSGQGREKRLSGQGREKHLSGQGAENNEDVDVVTGSRSLEEILDMDTNFATDLVSENIDMSDPVYESLFKLFGKDKEVFYDELRQEKKKTDEMAKEVEELEKSIQQDIANAASAYNSPIHSVEMALNSPDLVHRDPDTTNPSTVSSNPPGNNCLQPTSSCTDNNPGGFLPSLRDSEFGSPVHSTPSHRMDNVVSSPSSVVTQPFSPVEYRQLMSPSTPYNTQPATPTHNTHLDNLALCTTDNNHNISGTNGLKSPNSNGPMSSQAVGSGSPHIQHQSTPISNRHKTGIVEQMPNCSPLVKNDLNAASPIMVQKSSVFTPKSTYTPQSRKCIFTPQGTNRLLFSPPVQTLPGSPTSAGEVQSQMASGPQDGNMVSHGTEDSTVHNQSFGHQTDIGPPGGSGTGSPPAMFQGTNPCSTIANSIDCISLPQETVPEKPTSTRKSRRTTKQGGKKKGHSKSTERGVENGSSTFTTLKNLLAKPSGEAGSTTEPLSMPDLLCPPSPDMVQLSDADLQNQNIVLLSPGGTSYKIPVLDCQDEMGLATGSIGAPDTINVWESDLNNSTQYSILPENQITQSIVTSIEQGQTPDMTTATQVQKKKSSEKAKKKCKTKETKVATKKKKEKKNKKSGYFQSSSEKTKDNKESDEIYIASPLVWPEKTFVRNLDFGVDENKFRKILPKPSSNAAGGTMIIVNNNSQVPGTLDGTEITQTLTVNPQEPELTAVKIPIPVSGITEAFYNGCPATYDSTGSQNVNNHDISGTSALEEADMDVTLQPHDNSVITNQVDICAESDQVECGDYKPREESLTVETYKDWKGHMKTNRQQNPTSKNKAVFKTSTPLHVPDTSIKEGGGKSAAEQSDTEKKKKIIMKENAIKTLFKKSAHRISHVKSGTAQQGLTKIEKKPTVKAKLFKSSNVKVSSISKTSKKASPPKTDSSTENSEVVLNSSNEVKIKSPPSRNKKSDKKPNSVSPKGQAHRALRSKVSPSDTSKSKAKAKSKNLLKVKLPCSKSKVTRGKTKQDTAPAGFVLVIEEESSDDDVPLVKLQNKLHSKSPAKSPGKQGKNTLRPPAKSPVKSPVKSKSPRKSKRKLSKSPIKSPAQTPVKSKPSTPKKSQDTVSNEITATPSKETLLEKVGLTPTKALVSNAIKSPDRANPLDVLAEWQGSPCRRKKRHSGPVTRTQLNQLNGGFKSPSPKPKPAAIVKRKTPGRNLFKNFTEPETKEKVGNTKASKSSGKSEKSEHSNTKKPKGKKLFNEKTNNKTQKVTSKKEKQAKKSDSSETCEELNNQNIETEHTEKEPVVDNEVPMDTNKVTEDELQLALQSIQMETGTAGVAVLVSAAGDVEYTASGTADVDTADGDDVDCNVASQEIQQDISDANVLSEDLSISSEDHETGGDHLDSSKENRDITSHHHSVSKDDRNKDHRNKDKNVCVYRDEAESVPVDQQSELEVVEECTVEHDKVRNNESDTELNCETRTNPSDSKHSDEDKTKSAVSNSVNHVPNETNKNSMQSEDSTNRSMKESSKVISMQNVSDTGIEMSNIEENQLDEKARRKEKKRKHKEKKRLRKSLEAARLSQSGGRDTGIDVDQSQEGETSKTNDSVENSSSQHRHHHKHKHHHHGKHKKKKSKKRHREEEDSENKEKHKSKRRKLEASRALEMVDIDEALTEFYNSPIAAT